MRQAFGEAPFARVKVALQVNSTETIKQAVMAGMGLSFLSSHTIAQELRAGTLTLLDVEGFPLLLNWYLVQRRHKLLPPVAQAFKSFLREEGAALIERATSAAAAEPAAKAAVPAQD